MFSLKQYFLLAALFLVLGNSHAQTTYESPHVKDGKTMQFTFPSNYFEVDYAGLEGGQIFTTEEDLNFEDLNRVLESLPFIIVIHLPAEEESLESIKKTVEDNFASDENQITERHEPEISNVNGRDVMFAGAKGLVDGVKVDAAFMSAIAFGDYQLMIVYRALEGTSDVMTYSEFKNIVGSWKEVATQKEDELSLPEKVEEKVYYSEDDFSSGSAVPPPPPPAEEINMLEILEMHYQNSLFETDLSPRNLVPDLGNNWYVPMEGNERLLSEFTLDNHEGRVKVFSGGKATDYPSKKEIGAAVKLVTDCSSDLRLKFEQEFMNATSVFNVYSISNGGTLTSVYTTVLKDELIFLVVDEGSNPTSDFKTAADNFVKSMWFK